MLPWALPAMQSAATSSGKVVAGWGPWEADSERKLICRMLRAQGPGSFSLGGWGGSRDGRRGKSRCHAGLTALAVSTGDIAASMAQLEETYLWPR